MCGICGIIGPQSPEVAAACLQRMMTAMVHRGPDGEGLLVVPGAALGMRRLSIIDLPGGAQPIWNESGTLAVIFNGEIYNFRELRLSLESAGHVFRTQSDTEVLVHAYEAWGEDCLRHLRGMFAFAVLELPQGRTSRPRRVFLARDRLGIKPLYYSVAGGNFIFASEVRALLASDCIPRQLSSDALSSYLLFGSVSEPLTLVDGIRSLPPGHCTFVSSDAPAASLQPRSWWSLPPASAGASDPNSRAGSPDTSPASRVRTLLEDSVRSHLQADVPVGVFLSSGIDSTALAAVASRERPGVKTFTLIFPEQEFSEAALARRTAQRLGTEHAELLVRGEDMLERLDEALVAFDQPSMDGVNTFFVSWAFRQAGLKVALSGLGSDELFGGYDTFRSAPLLARFAAIGGKFPSPLRSAASALLPVAFPSHGRPDAANKIAAAIQDPVALPHPYFFTRCLFPPRQSERLLCQSKSCVENSPWWAWLSLAAVQAGPFDSFSAVSWLETRSYLVNTLLRDTDTMSMCHSLEVRVPFLDHPLVELLLRLPAGVKRGKGTPKALLVQALGGLLPEEIINRPKRTFTLPWEIWLRGPLRQRIESGLSRLSPSLAAEIDANAAQSVWQDFLAGRTSWSRPWSLYVLNEWARKNLDAYAVNLNPPLRAAASVPLS